MPLHTPYHALFWLGVDLSFLILIHCLIIGPFGAVTLGIALRIASHHCPVFAVIVLE